jgi:hypothetical protein
MQGTSDEQIATEMLLNSVAEKEIGRDGTTPALEFSQFKTILKGTSPHRLEQPRTDFECGAFNHSATSPGSRPPATLGWQAIYRPAGGETRPCQQRMVASNLR